MPRSLGVYTDGACQKAGGPGGWGFLVLEDGAIVQESYGPGFATTNNRMELVAAIAALETLPGGLPDPAVHR